MTGSYTNANITVNAQGQITEISNGGNSLKTETFTTGVLSTGQSEDFLFDIGNLLSLVTLSIEDTPGDAWVRLYLSDIAMQSDTRLVPGPPFPAVGLIAEVVLTYSEPLVTFYPLPEVYTESGIYARITNQGIATQEFSVNLDYSQLV